MSQVEEFLSGGGAPGAKFPTIGTTHKGTVVSSAVAQQREYPSGKPMVWDDGNPRMQLVVTIQTDERDPTIEDDDGERRLFLGGSRKPDSKSGLGAVIGALGRNKLEVGGTLTVKYVGGEGKVGDPKRYAAKYEPPVAQPDGIDDEEPF